MAPTIQSSSLDVILTLQLVVAWAGEAECKPPRLGWWRTDLIDPAGGGDLLARLVPRTHAWASLEAMREAAIRTDAEARNRMPDPDELRTLFFFGFETDERLTERLAHHKRSGLDPGKALPIQVDLGVDFSADTVASVLHPSAVKGGHTIVPGGRQMKGPIPGAPLLMAQHLAAELTPFAGEYPMPFYKVK